MFYTSSVAHTGRHLHARENGSREKTIYCKHPKNVPEINTNKDMKRTNYGGKGVVTHMYSPRTGNKGREHDEKTRSDHLLQG